MTKKKTPVKKDTKKTLKDFRKAHDRSYIVPERIKEALKQLGSDSWEYETVFVKMVGIGQAELNMYRDQFEDFIVETKRGGKRVWAGSKGLAEKMREMVL